MPCLIARTILAARRLALCQGPDDHLIEGMKLGRRIPWVCAVLAMSSAVASATTARLMLRSCEGPDLSGAYTDATPNVPCSTADHVVRQILKRRCWSSEQCDVSAFVCISYWSGSFHHPFSFSHHGICTAHRGRRIEFDLG